MKQSCPWIGLTHGLGLVGSRFFTFWWAGLGPLQQKYEKFERIILMHLGKIWLHEAVKLDFMADLTGTGN